MHQPPSCEANLHRRGTTTSRQKALELPFSCAHVGDGAWRASAAPCFSILAEGKNDVCRLWKDANFNDPLASVVVGECPQPLVKEGWVRVKVTHASLNRHDVFTRHYVTYNSGGSTSISADQ